MVDQSKMTVVLSEFAATLATDFPIHGILDHLVERIVAVLPVTSAGVTLISEGTAPLYVAASDPSALRFEELQSELGEGPCLLAYSTGEAVQADNLRSDQRFPRFGPAAVDAGLAAVFTFPLRHGAGRFGALDLYRDRPGGLDPDDLTAAGTLADVAAAYLLNAQARDEARRTSDRFQHSAMHDALTGLPNRVLLLQQRLEHAAQRAQRTHSHAAVLFVDLDRFKSVNDTYGHHVGDELLRAVARRLRGLLRPGDTLARVSGDEFVFLYEDLHGPQEAESLARRVDRAFTGPFVLDDRTLNVTASVGTAFAGPGQDISENLVAEADTAMYRAKAHARSLPDVSAAQRVIDLRASREADKSRDLEADLRAAYAAGGLDIAYQPIVGTVDGMLTGVEALLRWTHPRRGVVSPTAMVSAAEQSGLIDEIGCWVLERSCEDHVRWTAAATGVSLDLAVNVSARQLMGPGFCTTVAAVLQRTGMDPGRLVLEVTENILIEDTGRATTVLLGLRDLGLRIALDDFGTGYSSLSYLRHLPIDIVKIDRGFVADIGQAREGTAIVAAVTNLAHVLGLVVVAEGVETTDQHEQLRVIGCDYAQGFLFAHPMPAQEVLVMLCVLPEQVNLPLPQMAPAAVG